MKEPRFDTLAVHAGEPPDPATGALDPPVVLAVSSDGFCTVLTPGPPGAGGAVPGTAGCSGPPTT